MADKPAPIPQAIAELWQLVLAYFKQETTEPLKALGKVVAFGIAGSLLIGTGVVFAALGFLRWLQHDAADTFDGNWSFAPYLIVIATLLVVGALVFFLGTRAKPTASDSLSKDRP
ncbi:MAG: phage holin family protein [Acidimicrobiia bacterium]|nr:phage holin family protein [Acidimicrobiia bacterium]